ncbi:MAG: cytochrome C oxidase subunit IV family protein [Polyangiales bacterium]
MAATAPAERGKINHRTFALTFLALLLLAAASYGLSFVHLGVLSIPAAMAISLAKAVLVVLFFMELIVERYTTRVVVVVSVGMLLLLIGFMVADVWTRSPPLLPP